VDVTLSEEDREVLERWARRPKSAQALALRCRIVLAAADGETSKEIAERLGCTTQTVGRWRGRFAARGIDGLHDEPRPGQPRKITDEQVERVIVKTLEEKPADATPLVDEIDGPGDRPQPDRGQPDLAGVRAEAPSIRALQALARPAVRRQGERCRRALPEPARGGRRALRRREVQIQALDRSAPILPLMPAD
jgi:Winged helix-turn helix